MGSDPLCGPYASVSRKIQHASHSMLSTNLNVRSYDMCFVHITYRDGYIFTR